MRVTKHNNADQSFWIFYFLCVFGFLAQKQVKIDQKEQTFKALKKKKQIKLVKICTTCYCQRSVCYTQVRQNQDR